jgi:serine/threonine-protein kinase RsbW
VETRRIGGLGLHLVKNLMDDVAYRRVDERNRLRLTKRLDTDAARAD